MKKLKEEVIELLNECIPNSQFARFKDGDEILIIDSHKEKERFMYEVTKLACGQEVLEKHYSNRIVESKYSKEKRLDDGRLLKKAKGYFFVPDEVVEKFILSGLISKTETPSFETIIGCDYGFSDTYTTCHECNTAVRLYSSSSAREYFVFDDGSLVCEDCIAEEPEIYIEQLINNPSRANSMVNEALIIEEGFSPYRESKDDLEGTVYESGMHIDHSNTHPLDLYDELKYKYEEIIFSIKSASPFQTYYKVFVKDEIEQAA